MGRRMKDAGVLAVTPKVYLTDTLESPNQLPEFTASLLQAQLTEERTRAQAVKKDTRVFVCLGNPPYDREERDPLTTQVRARAAGCATVKRERMLRRRFLRISLNQHGKLALVSTSRIYTTTTCTSGAGSSGRCSIPLKMQAL